MQTIHKLASTHAASVETERGGGQNGYLAIALLNDASYQLIKRRNLHASK